MTEPIIGGGGILELRPRFWVRSSVLALVCSCLSSSCCWLTYDSSIRMDGDPGGTCRNIISRNILPVAPASQ